MIPCDWSYSYLSRAAPPVRLGRRPARAPRPAPIGLPGEAPAVQDMPDWLAQEAPFVGSRRPWRKADLIVCTVQRRAARTAEGSPRMAIRALARDGACWQTVRQHAPRAPQK